jgi:Txe/YoeB family toxin of Txe-Axe toxin-antitoxin module
MTINLHLSFSEGMGGQVFTESLSQGIPCLTSYTNEYLKFDKDLLELLTVKQYDNPWEIKNAIEKVLEAYNDDLSQRIADYSQNIDNEHHALLAEFLK